MSMCSRFLATLASGTRRIDSEGPMPAGSRSHAPSSGTVSGSPTAVSHSWTLVYGAGGGLSSYPSANFRTPRPGRRPRSPTSGRSERSPYLPMTRYSRHYANDVHSFDPEGYSARRNRFPQARMPPAPIRRPTRLESPEALTPRYRRSLQPTHDTCSVLEQSLRYEPFDARGKAFSVASASFWRMRGEGCQPELWRLVTTGMKAVCGTARRSWACPHPGAACPLRLCLGQ